MDMLLSGSCVSAIGVLGMGKDPPDIGGGGHSNNEHHIAAVETDDVNHTAETQLVDNTTNRGGHHGCRFGQGAYGRNQN